MRINKIKYKELSKRNYLFYWFFQKIGSLYMRIKYRNGLEIRNNGCVRFIKKDVWGNNNIIKVGKKSVLDHVKIYIRGNDNEVIFGENCRIAQKCSFWMEGSGIKIIVGDNCSIQYSTHFCAQEDNVKIVLGNDCMLSNNITFRTSDSHSIFIKDSNKRINPPADIVLGNHVWLAAQVIILKGVEIGAGSVVGTRSVVTKSIPSDCLAVGMPAKVIKENIEWSRERIS